MEPFNISWRAKEGYGDFITGLGYAHSSVFKYQRPVHITFHWPNPKNFLLSDIDKESILFRFEYIIGWLKPVKDLTISHEFASIPEYRFINELEEFNVLHGLWYPSKPTTVEKGLVVYWSSRHNLEFPGFHKDPVYKVWDVVVEDLKRLHYNVKEVTYRTPVAEVMDLISRCEFGIGYEGMVHQLFKFMWKPLIVGSQRVGLTRLLAPQASIITSPKPLLNYELHELLKDSKRNIKRLLVEHQQYINDIQDPTQHKLYNQLII